MPFGRDRKGPSSTAHIQDGLARFEAGQPENLLAKGPLPTKGQQPDQEIVVSSRVQDQAGWTGRCILIRYACHTIFLRFAHSWERYPAAMLTG